METQRITFKLKLFLASCALLLFIAGTGKLLATFQTRDWLVAVNEIVPVQNRTLLTFISIMELGVVVYIVCAKDAFRKLLLIAWLGLVFIIYRLTRFVFGIGLPCECIGAFVDYLPLSAKLVSAAMTLASIYLFAISVCLLKKQKRFQDDAS